MDIWRCTDEAETREAIAWAAVEEVPLRIMGRGTKLVVGRPVEASKCLDLSGLKGVTGYEPQELILSARAGTAVAELEAMLLAEGQMLAFDPPDLGPLLGAAAGRASLGGIISANLSGPRRFKAGAARDFVLGMTAINGQGEMFKSGGRVVKNVTGYDVPKLLTGAFGTLGVLSEIVLKVLPKPETECSIILAGLDDKAAIAALRDALDTPFEVSGAAHLPEAIARLSMVPPLAALTAAVTALRIEGTSEGLARRQEGLLALLRRPGFNIGPLAERGGALVLEAPQSAALWREIRDVQYFVAAAGPVWRVSAPPMAGPLIAAASGAQSWFYDWAGAQLWLLSSDNANGDASLIRRAVETGGGHATLIRGENALRRKVAVFPSLSDAHAALTKRVKQAFDPAGILNPGLMYPEI